MPFFRVESTNQASLCAVAVTALRASIRAFNRRRNTPTAPPTTTTLGTVAAQFAGSAEAASQLVQGYYQKYLGRTASAAELSYWVTVLQHGTTDQQVLTGFVSSGEYFQKAGNTAQGWLDTLYRDLLNRGADSGGESYWLGQAGKLSRADIASGFVFGGERQGGIVASYYQQYLGRTANSSEVAGWVTALGQGQTHQQVIAAFVGSPEYFQRHNGDTGAWLSATYQDVLGRQPDEAGFANWLSVL